MQLTNPFQDKDFAEFQLKAKKAQKVHQINGHFVYQYPIFKQFNLLYTDKWQAEIEEIAKKENSIFTLIESYIPLEENQYPKHFKHIIPQHTLAIDLSLSEEEILKKMHPKGRYNIRLAERKQIKVEESKDVLAFFRILEKTGERDEFNINPYSHYQHLLSTLTQEHKAKLYLAYLNDQAIAGIIVTYIGDTATYFYGASDYQYRKQMAPYALQWTAISESKKLGYKYYDFLGIADPGNPKDPLLGVSIFKQKFGGKLIKHPQNQVVVHKKLLYLALKIKHKLKSLKN
jgi:lipid II:glycine glycyltransferase (peptidoglycan interpeptide bridge formation enzyme)